MYCTVVGVVGWWLVQINILWKWKFDFFFLCQTVPTPPPTPKYLHDSKCQGFLKYFGMLWTKTKKHIRMLVMYMFIHYSVDEVWSTNSAESKLGRIWYKIRCDQCWQLACTYLYIWCCLCEVHLDETLNMYQLSSVCSLDVHILGTHIL